MKSLNQGNTQFQNLVATTYLYTCIFFIFLETVSLYKHCCIIKCTSFVHS